MPYALIDHATLTGVQRLLGEITIRSRESVEGDIASLENLVEAILFYDDIIALDDYKTEHKEKRTARFDFIRFLNVADYGLPSILEKAKEEAKTFNPVIRGGEFIDDDLRTLFEHLKVHMICTWDQSTSVFYLTMKMLGLPNTEEFKKYGKLSATIFNEISDLSDANGDYNGNALLYDSRGKPINASYQLEGKQGRIVQTGGMSDSLKAFIAALRWLAFRTIYYSSVAEYLRADVFLYPVRQSYHLHYMNKSGRFGSEYSKALIQAMSKRAEESLIKTINANRETALQLSIPIFSAFLVNQTGNVKDILAAALDIRKESTIFEAREQLREYRNLFDNSDIEEATRTGQKLLRELESTLAEIRRKYGLKTDQGLSVATLIKSINPLLELKGFKLPEIGDSIKLPDWLTRLRPRRGAVALYRDISNDLMAYPKLGKARDLLGAAVVVDKSALAHSAKTENPMYRNAKSDWKIPM